MKTTVFRSHAERVARVHSGVAGDIAAPFHRIAARHESGARAIGGNEVKSGWVQFTPWSVVAYTVVWPRFHHYRRDGSGRDERHHCR
jgi:hypothetical protein